MNILLVCNAGMSSSILVDKMIKAAKIQGISANIEAKSNNGLQDEIGKWDVCLLGPQIMYALESIKTLLSIPTETIDFRVYAMADGQKALEQALELIQHKQ